MASDWSRPAWPKVREATRFLRRLQSRAEFCARLLNLATVNQQYLHRTTSGPGQNSKDYLALNPRPAKLQTRSKPSSDNLKNQSDAAACHLMRRSGNQDVHAAEDHRPGITMLRRPIQRPPGHTGNTPG